MVLLRFASLDFSPLLMTVRRWLGSYLDIGIHTQTIRQLNSWVQLHQGLQDLRVYLFRRLVGANVLAPQLVANSNHMAQEPLLAIGVGSCICRLSDLDLGYICLIHIDADPKYGVIADGYDGIGHRRRVAYAFAGAVVLSENYSIDRRADQCLVIACLGNGKLASSEVKRPLRRRHILLASLGID